MTQITANRTEINKWVLLEFENHILVSYDGEAKTRIIYTDRAFTFNGKTPMKLPKMIQKEINTFMEKQCKAVKMAVWDVEAWTDYEDTVI